MGQKKKQSSQPGKPFRFSRQELGYVLSLADCSKSYWKAAQILAHHIKTGSIESHPMIFLYRHAIEASLKAILHEGGQELGITESEVRDRSHDLCKQLPDVRRVSQRFQPEMTRRTQETISHFHHTDPRAVNFRYILCAKGDDMDIDHFVKECDAALEELELIYKSVYGQISAELEERPLKASRKLIMTPKSN